MQKIFSTKDRLKITNEIFTIAECSGCKVLRTLPAMTETELSKYYPEDYWGGEPSPQWIQSSQSDKTTFVGECHLPGGRILDVGCGAGFFLRALGNQGWDGYGVEISPNATRAAAKIFGEEKIITGTLLDANFDSQFFDTVTFWSALEHTNQPMKQLLEARRILKPDGSLIIQVPNASSYQAKLFKGDWFALDAPRHRYHFDYETLNRALESAGFEIYHSSFQSKVHNPHALRQSLKARLWHSPLKRLLFLLAIPFLKPLDAYFSKNGKGATLTIAAHLNRNAVVWYTTD
ncbi:MAG: class I SAM-dependent methyltransferase [Acidobacteriota bacterium]